MRACFRGSVAEDRRPLGAPSRHPQPVAVGIFELTLPSGQALFVDGNSELFRDRIDVGDIEVDQRIGPGIALVLGEVEADVSSRHRDEPWEAGLELVLPLFAELEALVPGNSPCCILDVQNRHDLFVQPDRVYGRPASRLTPCCTKQTSSSR